MKKEIWRKIYHKEKETNYSISDQGRVRNDITDYTLTSHLDKEGYERISIHINGKIKTYGVHRLVAIHFIPNDVPERDQVNHKNCVKTDNYRENLEWATHKENHEHADKNGLRPFGEKNGWNKYKETEIIEVCELLAKGVSMREVSETTGVHRDVVSDISRHKTWLNITKNYTFPKKKMNVYKDYKKKIERLINDGFSNSEIYNKIGLKDRKFQMYISHLRHKKKKAGSTTIESSCFIDLCDVHTLQEVSLKISC